MRNLSILALLVATALPAFPAKHVTVDKFENILGSIHGKSDAEVAKRLSEVQLTERLSDERLSRIQTNLPGTRSRQALIALAAASAFLDLPASDIPDSPAPDRAAQDAMLASVFQYARETIPRLPNFFATRDTMRFEDTPSAPHQSPTEFSVAIPLHFIGMSTETVLYRSGHEVVDAGGEKGKNYDPMIDALSTSGAFGPILPTVLSDASKGTLAWDHWEKEPDGLRAVYRFAVPEQVSHYTVDFSGMESENQRVPAYHGEMEIDPADGTILRLTMQADLNPNEQVAEAGIMVKYGPVAIGGKTYICPVKSVARSLVRTVNGSNAGKQDTPKYVWDSQSGAGMREVAAKDDDSSGGALQLRVNDVVFRQYHLFRAEARILSADEAGQGENQPKNTPAVDSPESPQH